MAEGTDKHRPWHFGDIDKILDRQLGAHAEHSGLDDQENDPFMGDVKAAPDDQIRRPGHRGNETGDDPQGKLIAA